MLLILALFACGHGAADPKPEPAVGVADPPPATEVVSPTDPPQGALAPGVPTDGLFLGEADAQGNDTVLSPGTAVATDPQSLYGACKARVEGQEKPGECSTDADCSRAGCSQEVCVPLAVAPTVNTTCDKQPCFDVLESCGCIAGTCSWTVRKSP